jgi:hypothetical protein
VCLSAFPSMLQSSTTGQSGGMRQKGVPHQCAAAASVLHSRGPSAPGLCCPEPQATARLSSLYARYSHGWVAQGICGHMHTAAAIDITCWCDCDARSAASLCIMPAGEAPSAAALLHAHMDRGRALLEAEAAEIHIARHSMGCECRHVRVCACGVVL